MLVRPEGMVEAPVQHGRAHRPAQAVERGCIVDCRSRREEALEIGRSLCQKIRVSSRRLLQMEGRRARSVAPYLGGQHHAGKGSGPKAARGQKCSWIGFADVPEGGNVRGSSLLPDEGLAPQRRDGGAERMIWA